MGKSKRWEKIENRVIVNYIFVCKNLSWAKYVIPSAKLMAFIISKTSLNILQISGLVRT